MKPRRKIPTFKDEDAEREFWEKADSTEYLDWSKAQRITLPNFRPTPGTTTISREGANTRRTSPRLRVKP
jgi:hypothetical protein